MKMREGSSRIDVAVTHTYIACACINFFATTGHPFLQPRSPWINARNEHDAWLYAYTIWFKHVFQALPRADLLMALQWLADHWDDVFSCDLLSERKAKCVVEWMKVNSFRALFSFCFH
jgi:hypothetical protein